MTKVDALGNKKTSKIWHNWVIGNFFIRHRLYTVMYSWLGQIITSTLPAQIGRR